MKDWFTVQPDVVKLMNKHFTRGRGFTKGADLVGWEK